jgi:hypothetical protein
MLKLMESKKILSLREEITLFKTIVQRRNNKSTFEKREIFTHLGKINRNSGNSLCLDDN